jgi:hypothetical protein
MGADMSGTMTLRAGRTFSATGGQSQGFRNVVVPLKLVYVLQAMEH